MARKTSHPHRSPLRLVVATLLLFASLYAFFGPGVALVRDLRDPSHETGAIPERARVMHRDLTPRIASWAHDRVVSGEAADASLHDVPVTEWPLFTSVFYLMATEALDDAWRAEGDTFAPRPRDYAREAVEASAALLRDPNHHSWVRRHWGADYMHRENVFFRALLIAGLTSHVALTGDPQSRQLLSDQVETLAQDLDASELGLLDDYPGECYPIDVLVAVGWIKGADRVLGTDHSAFVARMRRAFTGPQADSNGLVPFRVSLPGARQIYGPARGIGNSWISVYAPDLWPDEATRWYETYADLYWRDKGWATGFREFLPGRFPEWGAEVDAGPILDGLGTSANAFGIAAARRNGRLDHAAILEAELAAASWTLPDGTLALPRLVSHAAAAPYLGEAAIMFFLTVTPAAGVPIVQAESSAWPGLVWLGLLVYFGVPLVTAWCWRRELLRWRDARRDAEERESPSRTRRNAEDTPFRIR